MPVDKYKFKLSGDLNAKLAELADANKVITLDPVKANKADQACYFMYQMFKLSENLDSMSDTIASLNDKVESLTTTVETLETSVQSQSNEMTSMQNELREANKKIEKQQSLVQKLLNRIGDVEQKNLDLERHSRSSNVRIGNITGDSKDEDCMAKTVETLKKVGLDHADIANCHRVGQFKKDKNRFMIIRFMRKSHRREVLAKRKDFFEAGYPLYEDLPQQDLDVKRKYSEQIQALHEKGDRCFFSRGAWYVNGVRKFWVMEDTEEDLDM